ncbi:transmembrane protein 252-like [Engraulis encrasicolus]|uniref:transmembrane protein 252-like n=1 Tax=Engraulis encrasicolus TaxID=184585 RepID=UPI002FCFC884
MGIILRLVLLFSGFSFICLGAYLKSLDAGSDISVADIFAYILVAGGFMLLLMGAFWSLVHGMKSNLYRQQRRQRRHSASQMYIYTVDRPNLYPPTYEESEARGHRAIPIGPSSVWLGLAPPLYTHSSTEVVNEAFSHEEPPPYQQALGHGAPRPEDPLGEPHQSQHGRDAEAGHSYHQTLGQGPTPAEALGAHQSQQHSDEAGHP